MNTIVTRPSVPEATPKANKGLQEGNGEKSEMKIPDKYTVKRLQSRESYEWLLKKHYAHRIPSITFCLGLFDDSNILVGVLTIGKPASPNLCNGICGKAFSSNVYELNRLCVNDGLEKNTLSFFVGRALSFIRMNIVLVSYADTGYGHHGYIYQATNWIYTGLTKERTDIGFEDGSHSRHYDKNIDKTINRKVRTAKHRYVFIKGDRKFKKNAIESLNYPVKPYPKGENKRYDSSHIPTVQGQLF
jgi:hypothetical protein